MRRHEAKDLVYEKRYTAGQLKAHLEANRRVADDRPSRLNKQFTRGEIWEILYRGVTQHPDDFCFADRPLDILAASNVIREFGVPLPEPPQ